MTDAMPLALQTVLAIVKIHARANAIGAVLRHAQKVVVVVAVKVVQDNAETIARVDVLKLVLPHVPKVAVPDAQLVALIAVEVDVPAIAQVTAPITALSIVAMVVLATVAGRARRLVLQDVMVIAIQLVEEPVLVGVIPVVIPAVKIVVKMAAQGAVVTVRILVIEHVVRHVIEIANKKHYYVYN